MSIHLIFLVINAGRIWAIISFLGNLCYLYNKLKNGLKTKNILEFYAGRPRAQYYKNYLSDFPKDFSEIFLMPKSSGSFLVSFRGILWKSRRILWIARRILWIARRILWMIRKKFYSTDPLRSGQKQKSILGTNYDLKILRGFVHRCLM